MANSSTFGGFYNLPAQFITGTSETALLVPAAGAYPSLPSPLFAAGNGLTVGLTDLVAGSLAEDGHAFIVRVAGKVTTATTATLIVNLYQVPGSIVSAGTSGTLSNDHVTITNAASGSLASVSTNFIVEAEFLWDSVSKKLGGAVILDQVNGANVAPNSGSAGTSVATTQITSVAAGDLNFIPSFTFSSGNAGNQVTVTEFTIDRA